MLIGIQETPSTTDPAHFITATNATTKAAGGLINLPVNESETGSGALNNAASWDDFPNGRFGDFKSPAYGDQSPYGGMFLPVSTCPTIFSMEDLKD